MASGASRCTIESKASLPALAATPTPEGDDARRRGARRDRRPATPHDGGADERALRGCAPRSSSPAGAGRATAPTRPPSTLTPITTPKCHVGLAPRPAAGGGQLEAGDLPDGPAEGEADRDRRVVAAAAQGEGEQERQEPDDAAEQAHRLARAARRRRCAARPPRPRRRLGRHLRPAAAASPATAWREPRRAAPARAPTRAPASLEHDARRGWPRRTRRRRRAATSCEFASTRSASVSTTVGTSGAAGDGVRLAEHEDDERQREQQEAVDVAGHQQARRRPGRRRCRSRAGAARPSCGRAPDP